MLSIFKIQEEETYIKHMHEVDINETNDHGFNALVNANMDKMKWLILYGINVNHIDNEGKNILFYPHMPIRFLIESGADVNALDSNGHCLLHNASKTKIDNIIDGGFDFKKHSDLSYLDYKQIRRVINRISLDVLETLTINPDVKDRKKSNIIFEMHDIEKVKCLVRKGVDIHMINKEGRNALFGSSYDLAKYLIENRINVNNIDSFGKTQLFYCHDPVYMDLLFDNGFSEINHAGNFKGETALFEADAIKSEYLIKKGIEVNLKNNQQANALFSCKSSDEKMNLLLKAGIDIDFNHVLFANLTENQKSMIEQEMIRREKENLHKHIDDSMISTRLSSRI